MQSIWTLVPAFLVFIASRYFYKQEVHFLPFVHGANAPFLDILGSAFGVAGNVTYDYVVVGAGAAGSAIAARLAEAQHSVAVVEAGGFYQIINGNRSVIPQYANFKFPVYYSPVTDWHFWSVPQKGLKGRTVPYPRGQALGGSTAINFLIHTRPNRGALDLLSESVGDESYRWDNVLPYYKKSVSFSSPDPATFPDGYYPLYNESAFATRGGGGPVHVSYGGYTPEGLACFLDGFNDIGIAPTANSEGGDLLGHHWMQSFINPENSQRSSGQTAYLDPLIKDSSTMTIYQNTLARRVLFSSENVATGVEVTTGRATYVLSASKEVILSAGVFHSPQLLMLSGVGPPAALEEHKISVVKALKGVGQNLHDQPAFNISYAIDKHTASRYDSFTSPEYATAEKKYRESRTGPLSASKYVAGWQKLPRDALSRQTRTTLDAMPPDWPDLEMRVQPNYIGPKRQEEGAQYTTVFAQLQSPQSRGAVRISSGSVDDLPLVDPAYFTDSRDMEQAVAAFGRIRDLYASRSLSAVTVGEEFSPGPEVASAADIEKYIRDNMLPNFNAVGTAKMGKPDDPMAVVDTEGRVLGVGSLRVVDLSILPFVLPGHPVSTAYMLGEKIADSIKSAHL